MGEFEPVYNPRLLDDIPSWVIENIQAVSAYMKNHGHEDWTIAGVHSPAAHAREVEALRSEAERLAVALEGVVGVTALGDLHQMRTMLKMLGAPSDDEKAMVAAVDALIARKDASISAEREG